MTDNNYVYAKGTLFVAPGGGSAPVPLAPGADDQALFADSTADAGVSWGNGSAMGDVVGPVSSVAGNIATYGDTSGNLIADSGVDIADVAIGPGSSTAHHLAAFANTDGVTLEDAGVATANVVQNASTSTANAMARFSGTGGKTIKNTGITVSDADVVTYPAGGGNVLTTGGGAARKGTFTLTAGASGDIATTAALTGSVIAITITALGTVTAPKPMYATITNGSKFVITSSDATDTSSGTWAIVA